MRKRLISDVPLGAFLSGGIDSSMIVALMAGMMDRPVQTFTIGFDDQDGFDERAYARLVAERYAHRPPRVRGRAGRGRPRRAAVWHHDQPFGDSSAVPTFLLNELTRQHVTVALSGDGGDELFAGLRALRRGRRSGRYAHGPRAHADRWPPHRGGAPPNSSAREGREPTTLHAIRGAGHARRLHRLAELLLGGGRA